MIMLCGNKLCKKDSGEGWAGHGARWRWTKGKGGHL